MIRLAFACVLVVAAVASVTLFWFAGRELAQLGLALGFSAHANLILRDLPGP